MTHNQPLHGIAVYNPDLLSKEELIQIFVARTAQLKRLVEALRAEKEGPPQHHLVSGRRGMGKTTLLRRLRYAIEDDAELNQVWLGLNFPEEQYNVAALSDFWLNCADALADTLEAAGQDDLLPEIDAAVERIQRLREPTEHRDEALALLLGMADRLDRRFVLCVDNVDLVLDRLKDEAWALREVLSTEQRIVLIGASSAGLEHTYQYDAPFYDFFRLHLLEGLNDEETFTIMRRLAKNGGHTQVEALLDNEPERIQTIRLLAGGNPRTSVLLFNLLAQGVEGDVRTDLERLLDQCTPLYKHRFEDLPELSQRVVDAMALHWHPITAAKTAEALHCDVNKASAQLNRLVKLGVVEKVDMKTRRTGFQIAERFFNIWYLMRASRRVRSRLTFLVEFLRLMFARKELAARGRRFLSVGAGADRMRDAEMGMALSYLTEDQSLRDALRMKVAETLAADPGTRGQFGELFDFEGEHRDFEDTADRIRAMNEARDAVFAARWSEPKWDPERFWASFGGSPSLSAKEKFKIAKKLHLLSWSQIERLTDLFLEECVKFIDIGLPEFGPPGHFRSDKHLRKSIARGLIDGLNVSLADANALRNILGRDFRPLACALTVERGEEIDFTHFTLMSLKSGSFFVLFEWMKLAAMKGIEPSIIWTRFLEARMSPSSPRLLRKLGAFLRDQLGKPEVAKDAYRQISELERGPQRPGRWEELGSSFEAALVCRHGMTSEVRYGPAEDPYGALTVACILTGPGKWTEAESYARQFIAAGADFHQEIWNEELLFFAEAIKQNRATEARQLLADVNKTERWRPLDLALEAAAEGSTDPLLRVAPEMRQAAELVLQRIAPDLLERP